MPGLAVPRGERRQPAPCAGVTHSTANGRSSISATPLSSSPAATCTAGSISSGPGAFQNGATDPVAAWAPARSPASSRALTLGRDGKPMYISGPHDDGEKIIRKLRRHLGDGNYDFVHMIPG